MDIALNGRVEELLRRQITEHRQIGVQVCAYRFGEPIIDCCAGQLGPDDTRPVQPDSLFSSFSTTKGVAATALHILADRGLIDYAMPVASYWPAFAENGKAAITVEQAMSHQAGLHAVPVPLTFEFVANWQGAVDWIAAQAPAWEPGTATGYHAISYGWIVGGIVQGAGGVHIRDVVIEEIAKPLGIEREMFIGIPDGVEDRLATLGPFPPPPPGTPALPADHLLLQAMPRQQDFNYNELRVRKACMPSINGHFSARALARMYAALANGGEVEGIRLVSPERIPLMQRVLTDAPDRVIGRAIPKGVGYFMGGAADGADAMGPRRTAFGHPGAGGSIALADPEAGLSLAVTVNQMHSGLQGEGPVTEICNFIRKELGAG